MSYEWDAGRDLARGLLGFIHETLSSSGKDWKDIEGIVVYRGPGSFTGLRIGLTVANTLADMQEIPIVGAVEESWIDDGVRRLERGESDKVVMPLYDSEPHITQQKK